MIETGNVPALALPVALHAAGYALRREGADDLPFLRDLYAATRAAEVAAFPWPDAQKIAFLRFQFDAQRHHYRTMFPDAAFDLLTRDAAPIGRLYVQRGATQYRVIDIALLPEVRGVGLGTAIFHALFAMAAADGRGVALSVDAANHAQNLYHRLGFVQIATDGVYLELEWRAAAQLTVTA